MKTKLNIMKFKGTPFTWNYNGNLLITAGGDTNIAEILPRDIMEEAEANAKLIAAAPDLLDALQYALHELNKEFCMKDNKPECFDFITSISEKAINKALK